MEEIKKTDILIVCLSYNNTHEVLKYIKNISDNNKQLSRIDIVVVENGNEKIDDVLLNLNSKELQIYYFKPQNNLGYLNGLYYGMEKYREKKILPKFVIYSNTDISIASDLFEKLDQNYKEFKGVIAPSVFSKYKEYYQNPFMIKRPSYLITRVKSAILGNALLLKYYSYFSEIKKKLVKKKRKEKKKIFDIYAPHGSFLIFTKEYFSALEKFKYEGFLYGEEIYIGEYANRIGYKVKYDFRLKVEHIENTTTGKLNFKRKAEYMKESMRFLKKYLYE